MDGEGCFRFSSGTPRIEVSSVYPPILHALELRFGGYTSRLKDDRNPRAIYRWSISGPDAISAVEQLAPLLIEKKPQAELLIQMRTMKPGPIRDDARRHLANLKRMNFGETE